MNFHTVNTCVPQLFRCLTEGFHHLMDLFHRHRAGVDPLHPAVRGFGCRGATVFHIQKRLCEFSEGRILQQIDHHSVDSHRPAETCRQLNEQLAAVFMELRHPLRQFFEHTVILVKPALAHCVTHTLHAGKHKADMMLGSLQKMVCGLLVKMAGLQPAEKGRSTHGALDDAILDFHIADLPRGEQRLIFFVHAHSFLSCII